MSRLYDAYGREIPRHDQNRLVTADWVVDQSLRRLADYLAESRAQRLRDAVLYGSPTPRSHQ